MLVTTPRLLAGMEGVNRANASSFYAGSIVAFAAGQFLFAPFLGGLSDRLGRKWIMATSAAIISFDYVVAGFATTPVVFLGSRLVAGCGSAVAASAFALASDVTKPAQRARTFGLLGACIGLGAVMGPFASAALQHFAPSITAWSAAILSGFSALFVSIAVNSTQPGISRHRLKGAWALLLKYGTRKITASYFLGQTAKNLAFTALIPSLAASGWNSWSVGGSLALGAASQFFGQSLFLGRSVELLGESATAVLATALAACGYGLLAVSSKPAIVLSGVFLAGLGTSTGPLLRALASAAREPEEQGALHGGFNSVSMAAWVIGPALAIIAPSFGGSPTLARYLAAPFFMASMLSAATLWLMWSRPLLWRVRRRRKATPLTRSNLETN